jgi:hypothetical protein
MHPVAGSLVNKPINHQGEIYYRDCVTFRLCKHDLIHLTNMDFFVKICAS